MSSKIIPNRTGHRTGSISVGPKCYNPDETEQRIVRLITIRLLQQIVQVVVNWVIRPASRFLQFFIKTLRNFKSDNI